MSSSVPRAIRRMPLPALLGCLRAYSRATFVADVTAGVTVGFVALPLAMAFAISSGMSPQAGLYCAVVAGGLISVFGGSRVQIGGPTGAFVVIVAGIVEHYGVDGLFTCTLMAGAMLIALGASGMGSAVRYNSTPDRGRLHQRHRGSDREHADPGFLRHPPRVGAERFHAAHGRPGAARRDVVAGGDGAVGRRDSDHPRDSAYLTARAWVDRGAGGRDHRRDDARPRRRDDRHPVWRHPERPAGVPHAACTDDGAREPHNAGRDRGPARRD